MNHHTWREIAERLSHGCREYSNPPSMLNLRIALPGARDEFRSSAPSSRKPKQNAVAVWVILILVVAVTGTFWAANQLCGVLAQRMQEMQRQRYQRQVSYSDFWNKGRH